MAHKKGGGSSRNGRESHSKRLGVKLYGGQLAIPGNIIIRQRGTKFHPGLGVGIGKDHTIYAMTEGIIEFRRKKNDRCFVNVIPFDTEVTVAEKTAPVQDEPVSKEVEKTLDLLEKELATDETKETDDTLELLEEELASDEEEAKNDTEEQPKKRKKIAPEGESEN